jgi:hypothetical protein
MKVTNMIFFFFITSIFQLYHNSQFYLVEETGVPGKNHRPNASHGQTVVAIVWLLDLRLLEQSVHITTQVVEFESRSYIWCARYNITWSSLSEIWDSSVPFSRYSCFFHRHNMTEILLSPITLTPFTFFWSRFSML